MSSIGTGYDLSSTVFSPAGRVFQVEYANKAVDNGGTVLALAGKDGVVFAAENMILSKLHERGTTRRTYHIGTHIGMAVAGLHADGVALVSECRSYANQFKDNYGYPITAKFLNKQISGYMHQFTLYSGARPCGCSVLIGSCDAENGPQLYMADPSGVSWGYHGTAVGKGATPAHAEIEKLKLKELSARELVMEAARIIYAVHDDVKDKEFELEMSWVAHETGGRHQAVPADLLAEAEAAAKAALEESEED